MPQNVDLRFGNDIVEAYNKGYQLAQQDKLRKQQLELETKRREQEQKQHEETIKQHAEEFKATFDLTQAAHSLGIIKSRQDIGKELTNAGEAGVSSIGGQVTGVDYGPTGETPLTISMNHPILGPMTFEHPLAQAARKGQETELTQAPLEARKIREQAAVQQEMEQRQLKLDKQKAAEDLIRTKQQQDADAEKARLDRESREEIARLNRLNRLAMAKARGTSSQVTTQAIRIANQFDTSDLVKQYNNIKIQKEYADTLGSGPGANDVALVYAFIRAQDYNRVTDTEFELASRYGQGVADTFGFKLANIAPGASGRFLTEPNRQAMLNTINGKHKVLKTAYENLRNETGKKFKSIGENPENWLVEYNKIQGAPSNPKIGDVNLKGQVWDGTGYTDKVK